MNQAIDVLKELNLPAGVPKIGARDGGGSRSVADQREHRSAATAESGLSEVMKKRWDERRREAKSSSPICSTAMHKPIAISRGRATKVIFKTTRYLTASAGTPDA